MTIHLQQLIQDVVKRVPAVAPYLSSNTLAMLAQPKATKALGDYSSIRDRLWDAIYNSVYGFLTSNQQTGTPNRSMATALSQAYVEAADVAYVEGGGSLPLDDETAVTVRSMLDLQFGYVDSLFDTLRNMRKEGDFDAAAEATSRADGYTRSLDMMYNMVKVAGAGNLMLEFVGSDGKESCKDCRRYKNKRHRAKWWIANNAVPPNHNFQCGGYNCEHYLISDDGKEFTL